MSGNQEVQLSKPELVPVLELSGKILEKKCCAGYNNGIEKRCSPC